LGDLAESSKEVARLREIINKRGEELVNQMEEQSWPKKEGRDAQKGREGSKGEGKVQKGRKAQKGKEHSSILCL
jgi:hypothetical protein